MSKKTRLTAQLRARDTSAVIMGDMIIALVPLCVMAFYYYGLRAALLTLTAVAVSYAADMAGYAIRGKLPNPKDLSSIVTGLIVVLMMPASVPYFIVVLACLFAILVMKHPFGGLGNNVFNPAAGGFAFVAISFPQSVFTYPVPFAQLEPFGNVTAALVESPAFTLKLGGLPTYDPVQMLLGNYPGPMGATNILVILTCLLFLLYRKSVDWRIPVGFVGASALIAVLFPRIVLGAEYSVLYELLSGSLLFGAVFVVTDPVTGPKTRAGRWLYGILAGVATLLFRHFGGFEEGLCFAVLILNSLSHVMDRETTRLSRYLRRWMHGDAQLSEEKSK
ncbi:RnfABCDGE type electron transport complex subunit D [Zongyangia hominis]|uniref:RnfABCDGE type electron transport complex subunit D n=1 Tax=Zongyangia hominis TaxID=2763677 RepID=A0A926IBM1_9FIRM|nr:RnfABCDGE type electron transport complex subunit D [Zongyangia hominis]MBC8570423.1 RnfABCDGE type electron transport complex subunit D [Zongyangia hominis]